jgi:hypothetical protein
VAIEQGGKQAMIEVRDLRGLPLGDPARETAYPREAFDFGKPMQYLHLLNTRWYYDASKPENEAEAAKSIGALCMEAETWQKRGSHDYKPFRIVIDNFGGTIIGQRV